MFIIVIFKQRMFIIVVYNPSYSKRTYERQIRKEALIKALKTKEFVLRVFRMFVIEMIDEFLNVSKILDVEHISLLLLYRDNKKRMKS